jgi:Glycosyl hydrolase family 79, N-terminal domain
MGLFNEAPRRAALAAVMVVACLLGSGGAQAQSTASVAVKAGTSLGSIGTAAIGVNTAVWDGNLLDAAVPGLLVNAGIGALRYPGGSTADIYNWQTNAIVPGQTSYANPNDGFDAFMGVAKKVGAAPIITVNYGTNAAGNGPGTPAAAAAWVQYANVTKGYGVKYWEIGNEIYGNGEYGSAWEADLHSAHDPSTYGANVVQFSKAMKAVDPTIKIGAVLTAPGNWPDGQSPDWNSAVLAQCAGAIDFVIVHWYAQSPGSESDAALLGAPHNGDSVSPGIASMSASLKALIQHYGGANAGNIQIMVTETNSVAYDPGKQVLSLVNGLFIADDMATWLENGAANVDVWDLHNGSNAGNNSSSLYGSATVGDYGILSVGDSGEPAVDTPFPTYYGLQMLKLLGKPGDGLVSTSSSNALLTSHAVLQANGSLALLLINKDPSNTTTVSVALSGYTPAATGTVYSYGKTSSSIGSANLSGLSSSFSVVAAPYSLTTILLTPGTVAPNFSLSAGPSSLGIVEGASGNAMVAVTPSGGFAGSVALAASGLPSGVTANFSPASTTGTSTLTLAASKTATAGTAVVTITGTSGSLSRQTTLVLTVTAPVVPDFGLSAGASTLALTQGTSTSSTITIGPKNGFAGSVALSASGLPAGVAASFNPSSTKTGSTLTLTASSAAATGTGAVTVTGTSGSLTHSLAIPLTVAAAAAPGGPASFTGSAPTNGVWYDEDDVAISTATTITALTLTITVPTTSVSYNGSYDTVGSQIADSHAAGSGTITYTYTLAAGQVIYPGSYRFAAQMNGNGTTHSIAGDSWSVHYTAGGKSYAQSGKI